MDLRLGSELSSDKEDAFLGLWEAGSIDPAAALFEKILFRDHDFLLALTCALRVKESSAGGALAVDLLRKVASTFPEEPAAHYELAIALPETESDLRTSLLEGVTAQAPEFENAIRALLFAYLTSGSASKLSGVLAKVAPTHRDISSDVSRVLNWMRSVDPGTVITGLFASIACSGPAPQRATLDEVVARLESGARQNEPLALVRLGDGEGAMARFDDEEEIRNRDLYCGNRSYFSERWYGQPYSVTRAALERLEGELSATFGEADVIGVPDETWIRHEAKLGHARSLTCCVNAGRFAARAMSAKPAMVTRTSIHYDLLGSNALTHLIKLKGRVAVVSSHREIPYLLRQRLPQIEIAHSFRVAPAYSDLEATGYAITHRAYTMADVTVSSFKGVDRSSLVLVGAGFVGKVIALRLRKLGYMVLDIGSIFDHIAGFRTRPNFQFYDLDACLNPDSDFVPG